MLLQPQCGRAETIEIRRAVPVRATPEAPLKGEASRTAAPVEAKPVPAEPVAVKTVEEKPIEKNPLMTASLSKVPLEPPFPLDWKPSEDKVQEKLRLEPPVTGHVPLLFVAVLNGDSEKISQLIAGGADPTELTPAGDTPLCAAVRNGSESSVEALLEGGATVAQVGMEKQQPLALACLRRSPRIIRALLAAGADPNVRFDSPVAKDVLERVTIKDLKGALQNDRGVTALMACASRGDVEGASELMRAGAKANICTTRYKRYPINFAATQGYLFLMRIILGRQPESEPEILVTIDLSKQRAWLMQEGKIVDSCSISTGRAGYATPAGRYVITDKHRSWVSTLYHVSMPFFMRLNCGAIGLHSGYVTGRPASHGCIRLPYEKAKKFFSICRVGDEVQIVH